ncbi:MAG: septal ring lytic transglycosylase RlpA family protein [Ginsengibacter sp.]
MKKSCIVLWLFACFPGSLHAQKKPNQIHKTTKAKRTHKKIVIKYGTASYYAQKFNGRRTASGEIFRSTKYTAACNVLPFNTWIKVTNLKNHKSVIVKVNDRLHTKNKRLVDLSKVAAQKLGYFGRGLTRVKIEVLQGFHR